MVVHARKERERRFCTAQQFQVADGDPFVVPYCLTSLPELTG